MNVCPSQNITKYHLRISQNKKPLAVNTIPNQITRTCGDFEPYTDWSLGEINYLDFKLTKQGYHLDLLREYLSSGTTIKMLHLCHFFDYLNSNLFMFWDVVLEILNEPPNRVVHLELFNIDYYAKTTHEENVKYLNQLNFENFYQVDYHHILSDSQALHYSIYTKELDHHYTFPNQYKGVQDVGVLYDPDADRLGSEGRIRTYTP